MISNMVGERKHGRTELSMRANIKMARSTEPESLAFTMVAPSKVNSLETRWRVLVLTPGMTEGHIAEIGIRALCTAKVSSHGKMGGSFAGPTLETRRRASARSSGPMDAPTKVCGKMGNSMVREFTPTLAVNCVMVFGKIVSGSNG